MTSTTIIIFYDRRGIVVKSIKVSPMRNDDYSDIIIKRLVSSPKLREEIGRVKFQNFDTDGNRSRIRDCILTETKELYIWTA